jgi:exopolyphosphatase/guanosine-5'-triphosphate,3'-diphosphate pyrophosphatase
VDERAKTVAVVDIGTNSTRLLIAEVSPGRVEVIRRHSRVTRLGRGVDLSGQLAQEAIEATCAVIADYASLYREAGVETVKAIATSAVRDARNGSAFIAELRERFALSAQVLGGEEEAHLTYLGATMERPPREPTLVIDIGGGSTELIVGSGSEIDFRTSLQIGVVRQTERHIASDPPATVELEALAADVRGLIEAAVGELGAPHPTAAIAVAGTPTSLSAIDLELEPYDSERVHGHVLALARIQRLLSKLASAPLSERKSIDGMHPDRAPTIVAGVVILIETMRAFGLDRVEASEHDILYGSALSTLERA